MRVRCSLARRACSNAARRRARPRLSPDDGGRARASRPARPRAVADALRGDPAIVGRSIRVGSRAQMVGVARGGISVSRRADRAPSSRCPAGAAPAGRRTAGSFAAARLKPGASLADRDRRTRRDLAAVERDYPTRTRAGYYRVAPRRHLGDTKRPLLLLLAAVGVVLLIACANVGNLLLAGARAPPRNGRARRARRRAGGSSPARSPRASCWRSLPAVAGLAFAPGRARRSSRWYRESVQRPRLADVGINGRVLASRSGSRALTAILFGHDRPRCSVEHASAHSSAPAAARRSRAARRATSALVVPEMALAIVLLVGAGLILRSFAGLFSVDPGLPRPRADAGHRASRRSVSQARARAASTSALAGAARSRASRTSGRRPSRRSPATTGRRHSSGPIAGAARASARPTSAGSWRRAATFAALGSRSRGPVLRRPRRPGGAAGRDHQRGDQQRFFPGESAVGRRVSSAREREIVGVVGNIRRAALTDEPRADMYFPFERQPASATTLFVAHRRYPARRAAGCREPLRRSSRRRAAPRRQTLDSDRARVVARRG